MFRNLLKKLRLCRDRNSGFRGARQKIIGNFVMKTRVTSGIVILLLMCAVLGDISFRGMLVCVHQSNDGEHKTVHFHSGWLSRATGQPCDESPTGIVHATGQDVRRHFALAMETLSNVQPSFKRALAFNPGLHVLCPESSMDSSTGTQRENRFQRPPSVFLDTAFTKTTILII